MSSIHVVEEDEAEDVASEILHDIVTQMGKAKEVDPVMLKVGSVWWEGLWTFDTSKHTRIYRLKVMVLREMFDDSYSAQIQRHMLTCRAKKRSLSDNNTIVQEYLKDGDVLELVATPTFNDTFLHFPMRISDELIKKATEHLPDPPQQSRLGNIIIEIQAPEFKSDVRKIMVTLIEHSLKLMSLKSNAKHIFSVVRKKLMCENFYVDNKMLSKYASTGASTRRLQFAISASYDDEFTVNQWLEETKSVNSDDLNIAFTVERSSSVEEQLNGVLSLFHQYLKCSFQLCPKAIDTLLEMGFNFDELCAALRYTGNNVAESVVYLLGYLDPRHDGAKPGLESTLSPTSDLYKEIMFDSEIVLPLHNPSVLYACLPVVDSNSFFVSSIRVPLLGGMLNKIVANYYAARCIMAINQMHGIMPQE